MMDARDDVIWEFTDRLPSDDEVCKFPLSDFNSDLLNMYLFGAFRFLMSCTEIKKLQGGLKEKAEEEKRIRKESTKTSKKVAL